MSSQPAPSPATPSLDALFAMVVHALAPERRWALEGWAAHLRAARHQLHAANSWAKHEGEFGPAHDLALAFTLARIVDFGEKADAAAEIVRERVAARSLRLAEEAAAPPRPARTSAQGVLSLRAAA